MTSQIEVYPGAVLSPDGKKAVYSVERVDAKELKALLRYGC